MGARTTQAAALSHLCDLLQARPGLAEVAVVSGEFPLGFHGDSDVIELWGTVAEPQQFMSLGGRSTDEIYQLHGGVYCWRQGADEGAVRASRDAAAAVVDELLLALRADPSLAGAVRVTGWANTGFVQGFDENGRFTLVEFYLRCEARLGPGA